MATLPKLDTSVNRPDLQSIRNSFASRSDSEPRSAGSSHLSPTSSRSSLSSLRDSFHRISSFSRTADAFTPESETTTPLTEPDSYTNPPSFIKSEPAPQPPSNAEAVNDGPATLQNLENVQAITCVAFGAFNRYYISWQDTDDEFHQKYNNLPPRLITWLFSSKSRHVPTLQITFGSGDDFFASDKNGKNSNRDSISLSLSCYEDAKKPVPRLGEVTRNFWRGRSNTISNPAPSSTSTDMASVVEEIRPKNERRRTFVGGHSAPMRIDGASIYGAGDMRSITPGMEEIKQDYRQRKSFIPIGQKRMIQQGGVANKLISDKEPPKKGGFDNEEYELGQRKNDERQVRRVLAATSVVFEEQTRKQRAMTVKSIPNGIKPQKVNIEIQEFSQKTKAERVSVTEDQYQERKTLTATQSQQISRGVEESIPECMMQSNHAIVFSPSIFPAIQEPTNKQCSMAPENRQVISSFEKELRLHRLWRKGATIRLPIPPEQSEIIEIEKIQTPISELRLQHNAESLRSPLIADHDTTRREILKYQQQKVQEEKSFPKSIETQQESNTSVEPQKATFENEESTSQVDTFLTKYTRFHEEPFNLYQVQVHHHQQYQPAGSQLPMGSFQDFFRTQYSLGDALSYV